MREQPWARWVLHHRWAQRTAGFIAAGSTTGTKPGADWSWICGCFGLLALSTVDRHRLYWIFHHGSGHA